MTVDFVLSTISATTMTMYMVAMFKLAYPTARTYMVVGCSLLSGVALSFVVAVAQGTPMTAQAAALCLLGGIGAAAGAAGVRSVDHKSDEKRADARPPEA
jgi:hypothetical protein